MNQMIGKMPSVGILWMRLMTGIFIAHHGYGKVFGGFMGKFTEGVDKMGFPFPGLFAWAAALSEFLGGILMALGLGTRAASFFVCVTMSVAAFIAHAADPFQKKELALLFGVVAVGLIFTGAGTYSLDSVIMQRFTKKQRAVRE